MPYYPYSDLVMDHFLKPRHVGTLPHPSGTAEVKNNTCGDVTYMEVRLKDDTLDSARFLGRGCGPGIACADYLIEMSTGRSIDDVRALSAKELARLLNLPLQKFHAAEMAVAAMHQAIHDAQSRLCSDGESTQQATVGDAG